MSATFVPSRDIPSLSGKVFVITGATAGLGLQTIETLAEHNPGHICFMARNATKAASIIERLKKQHKDLSISFIRCDMASLTSVKNAAHEFLAAGHGRLDVLDCNAGVMCIDPAVTEDGYQNEFQTNHLGHALLIKLLVPLLRQTAAQGHDVRIVNLTSQAYRQAPAMGIDFATLNTAQERLGNCLNPGYRWSRYGESKLANMLYADALAKQYPDITTVSVHPGFIYTDIMDGLSLMTRLPVYIMTMGSSLTVEEGAYPQLWAATTPKKNIVSGTYYEPVGVAAKRTTKQANDEKLANELWEWTQKALKNFH